jgi:hypothetical protein
MWFFENGGTGGSIAAKMHKIHKKEDKKSFWWLLAFLRLPDQGSLAVDE